jgi:UDP-N-acetylmuramoylalanine--D-glutamate ligase
LEISSFQLDNIKNFKPFIAVLLNVTPDHLDRYESFEKYMESKMRITENQNERDHFVFNFDDEIVGNSVKTGVKAKQSGFSLSPKVREKAESGAYIDNHDLIYFYYKGEEKLLIPGI